MKKIYKVFFALLFLILVSSIISLIGCAKKEKFTVSYLSNDGGYVSGETTQTVLKNGSTQYVAVNPYDGFYFKGWSDGDGSFVRIDKNVTSDITVTAIFEHITYNVDYISGFGGTVQGNCEQTVNMNDNTTEVTAIPNEGYTFVGWSDGMVEATRYEKSVKSNLKFKANFELKSYKVKFSADEGGTLDGEKEQIVKYGSKFTKITAMPDWGYIFAGWSDGVQTATRADTVYTDIDVTAYFKKGFEGGDGSVKNPFTICTYEQLCNIVFYPSEYFKLISDLDLTGIEHKPLFEESEFSSGGAQPFNLRASGDTKSFTGEFDGCGYTIKNLNVNCDSQYPSLFGVLGGGLVKNINIENACIKTTDFDTSRGKYYVGILAGVLNGFAKDISVSGEIIVDGLSHDGATIGGLTGQAFYPMINCSSNVNITAHDIESNSKMVTNPFCIGGLAGICTSWSVADCKAGGTILINNSGADVLVGGLIGYCFTSASDTVDVDDTDTEIADIRIVNSHTDVNIIENNSNIGVGGFIGELSAYKAEISECSSTGNIQAKVASGFFYYGNTKINSVIEKCHSECELRCEQQAFGFARYINNLTFSGCSAGGSIFSVGYVSGFFFTASGATFIDCYVESELSGQYAFGFGYNSSKQTIYERCGFLGSIQCSKRGAGICFSATENNIINCYSVGNIIVENAEMSNDVLRVGGLCSQIFESEIANCYFAGKIKIAAEYRLDSHVGKLVGYSRNSKMINCHTLHCVDDGIKNIVGVSIGEANIYDIVSYADVEEMHNIADILNSEQDEIVWQNVPHDLPKLANKTKEKIYENN